MAGRAFHVIGEPQALGATLKDLEEQCAALRERSLAQVGAVEKQQVKRQQTGALGPLGRAQSMEVREPSRARRDGLAVENHVSRQRLHGGSDSSKAVCPAPAIP